jgi:hypothetical protein
MVWVGLLPLSDSVPASFLLGLLKNGLKNCLKSVVGCSSGVLVGFGGCLFQFFLLLLRYRPGVVLWFRSLVRLRLADRLFPVVVFGHVKPLFSFSHSRQGVGYCLRGSGSCRFGFRFSWALVFCAGSCKKEILLTLFQARQLLKKSRARLQLSARPLVARDPACSANSFLRCSSSMSTTHKILCRFTYLYARPPNS